MLCINILTTMVTINNRAPYKTNENSPNKYRSTMFDNHGTLMRAISILPFGLFRTMKNYEFRTKLCTIYVWKENLHEGIS